MRVLLYENHFCYIKDIDQVCRAFSCPKCSKCFHRRLTVNRHEKTCVGGIPREVFPGGVYHCNPTPLETLREEGVPVPVNFSYPFRATFDFETYFTKEELPMTKVEGKTKYVSKHNLLSIGVCSNVEGYESPKCWITTGDTQSLVDTFIDYLNEISAKASRLLTDGPFKDAFEHLATVQDEEYMDISEDECEDVCMIDKNELKLRKQSRERMIEKMREEKEKRLEWLTCVLKTYINQLPVVGFNSGFYDLNVIKPYLMKKIGEEFSGSSGSDDNQPTDDDHRMAKIMVDLETLGNLAKPISVLIEEKYGGTKTNVHNYWPP